MLPNPKKMVNIAMGGLIEALGLVNILLDVTLLLSLLGMVLKGTLLFCLFLLNFDITSGFRGLWKKIKKRGKLFLLNLLIELTPILGDIWPGALITAWLLNKDER